MADVRGGIDVEYGSSDFDALGGHKRSWGTAIKGWKVEGRGQLKDGKWKGGGN